MKFTGHVSSRGDSSCATSFEFEIADEDLDGITPEEVTNAAHAEAVRLARAYIEVWFERAGD